MRKTAKGDYSFSNYLCIIEENLIPCTVIFTNGFQTHDAVLINHDSSSILMEACGKQQVVLRHAISTIKPIRRIKPDAEAGGGSDG